MNLLVTGFFLLILLISPRLSLAATTPTLLSPSDNSTISDTSPKLSWSFSDSCYASGSCFHVQVASMSGFTSIAKDYYTNSTSYSPRLSLQQWFWRVKAKDTFATWSDWSPVWSFIIVSTPSPTPMPSSSPSLIDNSTPTPSQDLASPTDSPVESAVQLVDESSSPTFFPIATSISVKLSEDLESSNASKNSTLSSKTNIFKSPQVKILGTSENIIPKILIALGIVIIISSAAFFLITYKKENG